MVLWVIVVIVAAIFACALSFYFGENIYDNVNDIYKELNKEYDDIQERKGE